MPLSDFRSVFLPYCLKRQADGRFAVLNREYKPVGFWTRSHVNYEDQPVLVTLPGLTAKVAAKVSYKGSPDREAIYLYNDGCIPTASAKAMKDYLQRLALLMRLKVKGEPPTSLKREPT